MDREVLTPDFLNAVANKSILVKVDVDSDSGKKLRQAWKVKGMPTVILADTSGQEMDRIYGYPGRETFVGTYLSYLYGVGTLADQLARAGESPAPGLCLSIAEKYSLRQDAANTLAWASKARGAQGEKPEGLEYTLANLEAQALLPTEPEKAIALLKSLVADSKSGAAGEEAFSTLGRYYKKKKLDEELVALYDSALASRGADKGFLNDYAWTFAERGLALEKALNAALKAVELSNSDPGILDTLAEVYFKMGKKEQAVATIDKAIAAKPDDEYFQEQKAKFLGKEAEK